MALVSTAIRYSDRSYSSRLDGSEQHSLSIVDSFTDVTERICTLILYVPVRYDSNLGLEKAEPLRC